LRTSTQKKNWPPISAALLSLGDRISRDEGKTSAPCGELLSTFGELAACATRSFAEQWQSTSFGPPNDACLRRFYKPFAANVQVKKGFDFVQDGREGPSVGAPLGLRP
jgi:hypothetical protein